VRADGGDAFPHIFLGEGGGGPELGHMCGSGERGGWGIADSDPPLAGIGLPWGPEPFGLHTPLPHQPIQRDGWVWSFEKTLGWDSLPGGGGGTSDFGRGLVATCRKPSAPPPSAAPGLGGE